MSSPTTQLLSMDVIASDDHDAIDKKIASNPPSPILNEPKSSLRSRRSSPSTSPRVTFSAPSSPVSTVEEKKEPDERFASSRSDLARRRRNSGDGVESPNGTAENSKKSEESSSSALKRLGKRLSGRFSDKKKGFQKVSDQDEDDYDTAPEKDPVVSIFEARNTQRVRWSLEGIDETPRTSPNNASPNNSTKEKEKDKKSTDKSSGNNIKSFMSKALFGSQKSSKKFNEEMKREVADIDGSLVWESADNTPTGPEVVHTSKKKAGADINVSFQEDEKVRGAVSKLLSKARRAERIHFRYEYAVKCYVKAMDLLTKAKYPKDHPTCEKVMQLLNNAHHVLNSYNTSANIVKMGIKYEDAGDLVRALKMYTIAYRIRRDNLSQNHPSLHVLLNMLASLQLKRGELTEAMQIYELALKDDLKATSGGEDDEHATPPATPTTGNLLAKSVTYREMGIIHERQGNVDDALSSYHKSLECVSEWKEALAVDTTASSTTAEQIDLKSTLDNLHLTLSAETHDKSCDGVLGEEQGEMEIVIGGDNLPSQTRKSTNVYESYFPPALEKKLDQNGGKSLSSSSSRINFADTDLALTLHHIAQLFRRQGDFGNALDAFEVSLRGMKCTLGKYHPNAAAALANIGNLLKEMGDYDAAFKTYQEVLGIESYRLGMSHPDVAITLVRCM